MATTRAAWGSRVGKDGWAQPRGFELLERRRFTVLLTVAALMATVLFAGTSDRAAANPASVTIAGSLQSELGCPGDWDPACEVTHLALETEDDVWQAVFTVPAGSWEYKAALNDSWDENYGLGAVRDGPNIPLAASAAGDVKFYYDDGTHWVTDNVNSVIATVPGSFQSELGCGSDWDPSCLRSWLQDPDGDGVASFSTSLLPPGDYEAKVAIDESWDENYGAEGVQDGANIPFTVETLGDVVFFSYDEVSHILTIEVTPVTPVDDSELVREPVRHPFVDEVLYFAIPDRFNDGNPSNNCGEFEGPCLPDDTEANILSHGYLPSDKGYYHGGDLEGLRRQLPYLQNLGVGAVWVGPIFQNKVVQPDSTSLFGMSAGYHGYWILDFLEVDPHLGTNEEFTRLVDEAHERGIKVFMDIVTNHTADVIQLEGNAGYRNKTDFPYLDVNDQPFDDSDHAYSGQSDYTFPEVDETSFPYLPVLPDGDEEAKSPAWLNDPLLYHNRGNSSFVGENSLYGDFFGLDDLWTERREVV
ncbi:MAG TPA: alpha-amylase family glycosyl hydrolase, partial [Acidimicrobiia bacterium]